MTYRVVRKRPQKDPAGLQLQLDRGAGHRRRILDVGAVARVEFNAPPQTDYLNGNGAGKASDQQFFEVELSAQKLSELNLAAGQPVRLVSSRLQVFDREAQT